jgi:transposase-like protein
VAREVTADYRTELWDHFCEHGNKPYYGVPSPRHSRLGLEKEDDVPSCQLCKKPYVRYGGRSGSSFASFLCDGCGHGIQTTNGGKTWALSPRLMNDRERDRREFEQLQTFKVQVRRAALERELGRNNESFLKTIQNLLADGESS